MIAAFVNVSIEPEHTDSSRVALKEMIVPMVSASPGFVAGYWMEPVDGKSASVVVFDTEANAKAAVPAVGPAPAPGIVVTSVEFREVAASA